MSRAAFFLSLLVAVSWPSQAAPQSGAGAEAPSEEAISAALELFADMDLEQQMLASVAEGMNLSFEGQLQQLQAQGKEMPEKLVLRLRKLLADEGKLMVGDMMPTIRLELAAVYARRFTVEELRELKRLQAHPVMKTAEKLMPEMFGEMGRIGMKASAARMPAFQKKVEAMVIEMMSEEQVADGPAT